jgi:hypothetical protein
MLIFWLVDLGLVASLAKKWKQPQFVSVIDTGSGCSGDGRCDLKKVDHTSADTYAGALVAGAVLAAFEVYVLVPSFTQDFANSSQCFVGSHCWPPVACYEGTNILPTPSGRKLFLQSATNHC